MRWFLSGPENAVTCYGTSNTKENGVKALLAVV